MGRRSEFSRDEKIAAVKKVTEEGCSPLSVATEYGIHVNTLGKWRQQYAMNPEGAFANDVPPEPVQTPMTESQEIATLKKRIRELEEENEFLKKVSAYFAKNTPD